MKVRENIRKVIMYKTVWCADCKRAQEFFNKFDINVEVIDIDKDASAERLVLELNNGRKTVPTIIVRYADDVDTILVEPGFTELEATFLK